MNTTSETHGSHSSEMIFGGIAGGSRTEGIGAVGTIILAILGLAGIFSDVLASIATIVVGVVILMDGLAVSMAARRLHTLAGGATAGFFGGLAGIILGILSLFRVLPNPLLATAVLVYGVAILLGGGVITRMNWSLRNPVPEKGDELILATTSGNVLIGLAAVVLGILAIIGLAPMTLVLVGLLSLGAGALFSGSTAAGETM